MATAYSPAASNLPRPQRFRSPGDPVNNERFFGNHSLLQLLDKCSNTEHLKQIHARMLRVGLFSDPFSASKLIQASALSEYSSLEYAQNVFDQIPHPNLYSWNALIRSYASRNKPFQSLMMFVRMLHESDDLPNKFTYPFVIKASAEAPGIGEGLHAMVLKSEFRSDLFVLNSLIHFYAQCGCLDLAYRVFLGMPKRDLVSWNSMIVGFAQGGYAENALDLFRRMEEENFRPNDVTLIGVLSACGKKGDLEFGRWVHLYIKRERIKGNSILNNAILDMYVKCGSVEEAERLFDRMEDRDIISWTIMLVGYTRMGNFDAAKSIFRKMPYQDIAAWNALISAYEQSGNPREALVIFNELQLSKEVKPDSVTLVCALSACAQLGAMGLGGWIHAYIENRGMKLTCHLTTALIDMYSKCGDLQKALEVFHSVENKDVFVWSSMIAGLAMHGCGKDAVNLFLKMQEAKVKPNAITFINLLSACSHSGLVDEGRDFFNQMEPVYGVEPGIKQYSCLVDILGRAGHLEEAVSLIENMPITPEAPVWGALLGVCGLHGNLDLAEWACRKLLELEPQNHGAYVLLSNMYARSGEWDKVSELRKLLRSSGLKKEPGCSSVEADGVVHEFLVGDNSHPLSKKIYSKLDEMIARLRSVGYAPDKSHMLQLVEEEDVQDQALYLHSEKLAMAFGLISISPSQPIRIVKNLRICGDCHVFAKKISVLYDREILLRDRFRFHHFKGGECSCMDYW